MKEEEDIYSKIIKECIIKDKIVSVQQLHNYLNYSSKSILMLTNEISKFMWNFLYWNSP